MTDAEKVNWLKNKIRNYLSLCAPHIKEREGHKLLADALKTINYQDTLYGSKIKELEAKIARMEGVVVLAKRAYEKRIDDKWLDDMHKALQQLDEVNREEKVCA